MGEWIYARDKAFGEIRTENNDKLVFVAASLELLCDLFRMDEREEIETETKGKMLFGDFKRDYLPKISAFYPSMEAWILKNQRAKRLEEVEKYIPFGKMKYNSKT